MLTCGNASTLEFTLIVQRTRADPPFGVADMDLGGHPATIQMWEICAGIFGSPSAQDLAGPALAGSWPGCAGQAALMLMVMLSGSTPSLEEVQ